MEERYKNREIDAKFLGVHDRFDKQDQTLGEILNQTKKTNGRVSSLENWKWMMAGGMVIISMMVIPLVIYIFNGTK